MYINLKYSCGNLHLWYNLYMARRKKIDEDDGEIEESKPSKRKGRKEKEENFGLKTETKNSIWGVVFIFLAIFVLLSLFRSAGVFGKLFYNLFNSLLGVGYFVLPVALAISGVTFLKSGKPNIARTHMISGSIAFLSILGILHITKYNYLGHESSLLGGIFGKIVAWPFLQFFGKYAGLLFLGTVLIISLIVIFDERPNLQSFWPRLKNLFTLNIGEIFKRKKDTYIPEELEEVYPEEEPLEDPVYNDKVEPTYEENEDNIIPKTKSFKSKNYVPPPLSLLEKDKGKPNVGDIKSNMNIIQRTLLNFGIQVEMDEVTIGPTVTRYALKPAQGMKLSKIVGLQNDLALALAAHPIRIEAPIPGKSLVGIEIPNRSKSTVGLATLLSDEKFTKSGKPLTVALGKGLSGKAHFGNLAKMPHMLIAGATGSGKSVTIHSVITSLLYRNGPEDMRLIMVDPKRVELTLYNKIPHLLTQVITNPKQAILALKWAAKEMDRRYDLLEKEAVRDIESYHQKISKIKNKEGIESMPYIVVIIDELADIMQTYPRELEAAIVRLAQMSRAVGIHLILSTQRPSVNVITGLIKANVPTRLALQVSSQVDSRTILDAAGAEKLLGAGDMLFSGNEMSQPERLQSAFISEEEVKKVVQYLKDSYQDELRDEIELSGSIDSGSRGNLFSDDIDNNADDDLYEDARITVIESGKASTSYLQRKLGIGYARAAKLIDMLEDRGVVGPQNGSKPRDVLEQSVDNIESSETNNQYE